MATETTVETAPVQACRVCLRETADGEMVPNLDGHIYFCKACATERRKRQNARADRIRGS